MKCKLCGQTHNGSKEAIVYHKKQCLIDLKERQNDPLGLKRFS